ncbi:MAG: hypothetical protein IJN43_13875 [Ruminococcus sp.]|nr:hypothetical protein [Ruminococcus sp.]
MLVSEVIKLLEALNEEQLCYVYTYIKEYFQVEIDAGAKKTAKVAEALK